MPPADATKPVALTIGENANSILISVCFGGPNAGALKQTVTIANITSGGNVPVAQFTSDPSIFGIWQTIQIGSSGSSQDYAVKASIQGSAYRFVPSIPPYGSTLPLPTPLGMCAALYSDTNDNNGNNVTVLVQDAGVTNP